MRHWIWLAAGVLGACGGETRDSSTELSTTTSIASGPAVSNPLRQGFTQRPSPDTPGLPPPIAPILTHAEREEAAVNRNGLARSDFENAQREIDMRVSAFQAEPTDETLVRLRQTATDFAKAGQLTHLTIGELYAAYLFPNPESEADAAYKGKFVLLTGTVAPANMKDMADGFKLIEQNPYVHDPLLLATDYELSFVECRLVQPELQELRDWQPIHLVAEVAGKRTSDVLLERCVVL